MLTGIRERQLRQSPATLVSLVPGSSGRRSTRYERLLPPIGCIGTTGGRLILFLSMHLADDSLELGALAIALTSSVFALIAYAGLEGLKIRLYARLLGSIRDVEALYHKADARREQVSSGRSAMPKGATA